MDAKEAVKIALQYVAELFAEEQIANLGLEEVTYDDVGHWWDVTVGFSRPWDYPPRGFITVLGQAVPQREYKTVRLNADSGKVLSVKNRESK